MKEQGIYKNIALHKDTVLLEMILIFIS